jgi:hypothetical protein
LAGIAIGRGKLLHLEVLPNVRSWSTSPLAISCQMALYPEHSTDLLDLAGRLEGGAAKLLMRNFEVSCPSQESSIAAIAPRHSNQKPHEHARKTFLVKRNASARSCSAVVVAVSTKRTRVVSPVTVSLSAAL